MSGSHGSSSQRARVLVVDDEAPLRRAVVRWLEASGYEVVEAADGAAALKELTSSRAFDAVLTDIMMPELDGLALLRAVRAHDLDVPVIVTTGAPTVERAVSAIEHGACAFLTKPIALPELRAQVDRAVALGRVARAKRVALEAMTGEGGGAGDLAGLEATFDRTMQTLWSAYQPIVDAEGRLFAHEALMRSRERELPHPGAVLDAAEKLGRLTELGRHMRAISAAALATDDAQGLLFVNLHPRDLLDDDLLDAGAPLGRVAPRVVLEITERAALERLGDVRARTQALRAHGYRIAIDDLGAGYAGLTSFALLEPDIVKLDMSLIRDVDKSPTKQKLVQTMSSLCRDLGMRVVAEGVETVEELRVVLDLGCHLFQGYLIAKPGPAFPTVRWPL